MSNTLLIVNFSEFVWLRPPPDSELYECEGSGDHDCENEKQNHYTVLQLLKETGPEFNLHDVRWEKPAKSKALSKEVFGGKLDDGSGSLHNEVDMPKVASSTSIATKGSGEKFAVTEVSTNDEFFDRDEETDKVKGQVAAIILDSKGDSSDGMPRADSTRSGTGSRFTVRESTSQGSGLATVDLDSPETRNEKPQSVKAGGRKNGEKKKEVDVRPSTMSQKTGKTKLIQFHAAARLQRVLYELQAVRPIWHVAIDGRTIGFQKFEDVPDMNKESTSHPDSESDEDLVEGRRMTVIFSHNDGQEAMSVLSSHGFGSVFGTVHSMPLHISKYGDDDYDSESNDSDSDSEDEGLITREPSKRSNGKKDKKKQKDQLKLGGQGVNKDDIMYNFVSTMQSKLIVEQVAEGVLASAVPTFDYFALAVVASLISTFGLLFDSAVIVVAAMLVSPLMGPIMSYTFGWVIRSDIMVSTGWRSELIGMAVCLVTGWIVGIFYQLFVHSYVDELPYTDQISSRGTWQALVQGVCIAIPSGAGVALSLLKNNQSSLVGVAISASLLPPIVNSGLLYSYAMIGPNLFTITRTRGEYVVAASYSLALAFINVLLIVAVAAATFKFKQVAPFPGKSEFWKTDVNAMQQTNAALKDMEYNEPGELQKLAVWAKSFVTRKSDVTDHAHEMEVGSIKFDQDHNSQSIMSAGQVHQLNGHALGTLESDHGVSHTVHTHSPRPSNSLTMRSRKGHRRVQSAAAGAGQLGPGFVGSKETIMDFQRRRNEQQRQAALLAAINHTGLNVDAYNTIGPFTPSNGDTIHALRTPNQRNLLTVTPYAVPTVDEAGNQDTFVPTPANLAALFGSQEHETMGHQARTSTLRRRPRTPITTGTSEGGEVRRYVSINADDDAIEEVPPTIQEIFEGRKSVVHVTKPSRRSGAKKHYKKNR
eukprot:Clim_evm17s237 gene=Clim_evmTU17s237